MNPAHVCRFAPGRPRNGPAPVAALILLLTLPVAAHPAAKKEAAGSPPAAAVAIVGGTIYPVSGPPIPGGTVLIRGGKIEAVGKNVAVPPDARRVDAKDHWVLPGLIDSRTHLGLWEVDLSPVTRDEDEKTDPVTPQMRVIDAFYDQTENIQVTRQTGVALALVTPGDGNLIDGQSALVDLSGGDLSEVLIKFPVAMHFSLGEPPKARYGSRDKSPATRMGNAAVIRTALIQAQDYQGKWDLYERKVEECGKGKPSKSKGRKPEKCPPDPPSRDLKLDALLPVLKGDLPAIFRAQRMDDILTALRLADEFKLKLIISHAAEGYKVADLLASRKIPVIVGPVTTQPDSIETLGAIYENAARLAEAGVKIAIQSDQTNDARILPWEAGLAVTYGLPWDQALRAVTLNAAEILGVADRIGSLEKGKDADLIVTSGDPFQPLSHVRHLFIRGNEISLRSRQDDLAEKYR